MNRQEWHKINAIVDKALDLAEENREPFIEQKCEEDSHLLEQVRKMLNSIKNSESTGFLEGNKKFPALLADNAADILESDYSSSLVNQVIGNYRVRELIGHGGMGSVYRASHIDDNFDQQVAIKILRRGMDTPSNRARFHQERIILAGLDHPNIARLLNGGVTEEGLPYLVMEYVEGCAITEYCNQKKSSIKDRLKLFVNVLEAVQHAHKNAVIHRDLKPSNILVTPSGQVKILDFGIAKLLQPIDKDIALHQTRTGHRLLSLGYASPEQVNQDKITTATDTYALGILLYELLAGIHPFDLADKNLTQIEKIIREKAPDSPSIIFGNQGDEKQIILAEQRNSDPASVISTLSGDLDAIIMKALRKEPGARYNSVDQFMADLDRMETDLPILAREDTLRYKTGKFLKRHGSGLSIAAGIILLLSFFLFYHSHRLSQERNQAQREAKRAEAVTGFLTELIQSNYPENAQGDTITVRAFLDRGFQKVQQMDETPLVKGEIMKVMGHTYRTLGETEKAETLISQSLNLLKGQSYSTTERAATYNTAGLIYRDLGKAQQSADHLRRAVDLFGQSEQSGSARHAKALRDLAYVEKQLLKAYGSAEKHIQKAISINRLTKDKPSVSLAESYYVYASLLRTRKHSQKALTYHNRSLEILQELAEGPHPGKSANLNNMAIIYQEMDSIRQAISFYRQSLEINRELYGENHFRIANNATNLAKLYLENGQIDSASKLNINAIQIAEETLSEDHHIFLRILRNQGSILNSKERYRAADSTYQEAISRAKSDNKQVQVILSNIYMGRAENAVDSHSWDRAKDYFYRAFKIRKKNFGSQDSLTRHSLARFQQLKRTLGNTANIDSLSHLEGTR